jgi:transcriptional regulator with GAF, ATPase, and Fis domain
MKKPRLVVISGPWAGTVWRISSATGLRIGRDPDKNDIVLDDPTLSATHASFEIINGITQVRDEDSANGIVVNEIGYLDRALQHGDVIELGISKVVYLEHDDDPDAIPVIVQDETDKSRKLGTLKVDRSSRGEEAIYQKSVRRVLEEMAQMQANITELEAFISHAAELMFGVNPASRMAILVDGRPGARSPEEFKTRVWRERDVPGHSPFGLSPTILEELFDTGNSILSNRVTPVIGVPIKLGENIVGILYVEGRADAPFDADHRNCAESIANHIATAVLVTKVVERADKDFERIRATVKSDIQMIGNSAAIKEVLAKMAKAARHNLPVLITGPTGTGKELAAQLVHALSPRKGKPCVTVHCGAIAKDLVESELFGHMKGSFTGADRDKKGQFEEANGGTIFLDEIGDMPLDVQLKVLRVVEYGQFRPVGGGLKDEKKVDVRIIAATRVDLNEAMESGKFRDDLFERLNGVQIYLPPLSERPEDIDALIDHFINRFGRDEDVTGITDEAREILKSFHWPRNIRQLMNAVRQAVVLREKTGVNAHLIRFEDLPDWVFDDPPPGSVPSPSRPVISKQKLERTLLETSWNVKATARKLKKTFSYIYRLMRQYGLKRPETDSD